MALIPYHDDVIKWKHFPRYWPFVLGIRRSPVNSPHKGQWHGALMFSLICARINGWVNKCETGDWRCHCAHYDFTVMPHWGQNKMATILQTCTNKFYCITVRKLWCFDLNFTEICSQWFKQQNANIGLDNGLAPNRWQAIIWTDAGLVCTITEWRCGVNTVQWQW